MLLRLYQEVVYEENLKYFEIKKRVKIQAHKKRIDAKANEVYES